MIEQTKLLEIALHDAFTTGDGQRAWKPERLPDAAIKLAEGNYAILCGEAWIIEGSFISTLSPRKTGGWGVFSWETVPRQPGEPWEHYVSRTLRETLSAVGSLRAEDHVSPEFGDKLYYHMRYTDEIGYHKMHAQDSRPATFSPQSSIQAAG